MRTCRVIAALAALTALAAGSCAPEAPPAPAGAPPRGPVLVELESGEVLALASLEGLNAVLDRLDGQAAAVRLAPGRHQVRTPLRLPAQVALTGAGQGVSVIEARARLDAVIAAGSPGAATHALNLSSFSVDCAGRADDGLRLIQAPELVLTQVSVTGCRRTGVRLSGAGSPTRGAVISDLTVQRNRGDGLMVLWGARNVRYSNIFAYANDGAGVVFDHSEGAAVNIIADQNGAEGIVFRNLFAFNAANLTATRNGREGVRARGFVASAGQGWIAMGNSLAEPGAYDEVRFTAEADLSYGVTRASTLTTVIVGAYEDGSGPPTARSGVVLEPGVEDLTLSAVTELAFHRAPGL